ncbi:MAG: DUF5683 domain-containing protein [Flavobacteriales bacterium Tduv]
MRYTIALLCWLLSLPSHAQKDTSRFAPKNGEIITDTDPSSNPENTSPIENIGEPTLLWIPSPTKAALYSTILLGLGQAYNKKYWKIPIIWGLLAGGLYSVAYNQKQFHKWNDIYLNAINGIPNPNNYSIEQLVGGHAKSKRNYSYSILFTAIIYILNIFDALVDAHLYEIDHDKDLLVSPAVISAAIINQTTLGLSLQLKL